MSLSVSTSQEQAAELAVSVLLAVARLGEADLSNWWSSRGMDPEVQFALSGFPNTSRFLGAELALISAKRRHEQVLRRNNAVHLFSPLLPFFGWTRAYLAERKTDPRQDCVDELFVSSVDVVRHQLERRTDALAASRFEGDTIAAKDLDDRNVSTRVLALLARRYLEVGDDFSPPHLEVGV